MAEFRKTRKAPEMATKPSCIISLICGLFAFTAAFSYAQAEGVFRMKSNSPNVPFVAAFRSRADRVRRETSRSQLTASQRQEFLTSHNNYRKNVNPPAANMQKIVSKCFTVIMVIIIRSFSSPHSSSISQIFST